MSNFMYILWHIAKNSGSGKDFLIKAFLQPNVKYFDYSYEFDNFGNIIKSSPRHFTDRNQKEDERYFRIALDSVYDYNSKENRNTKSDLTPKEMQELCVICKLINDGETLDTCKQLVEALVVDIEARLIDTIS